MDGHHVERDDFRFFDPLVHVPLLILCPVFSATAGLRVILSLEDQGLIKEDV